MVIAEHEVWLRAYCAALTGTLSDPTIGAAHAGDIAKESAERAVKDFAKRFPAFRFHSEENKE